MCYWKQVDASCEYVSIGESIVEVAMKQFCCKGEDILMTNTFVNMLWRTISQMSINEDRGFSSMLIWVLGMHALEVKGVSCCVALPLSTKKQNQKHNNTNTKYKIQKNKCLSFIVVYDQAHWIWHAQWKQWFKCYGGVPFDCKYTQRWWTLIGIYTWWHWYWRQYLLVNGKCQEQNFFVQFIATLSIPKSK